MDLLLAFAMIFLAILSLCWGLRGCFKKQSTAAATASAAADSSVDGRGLRRSCHHSGSSGSR